MITKLACVVPKYTLPRDGIDTKNFERVTGIKKTRRWTGDTHSLICEAVKRCIEGIDRESISAVIVVTQSPDRSLPCMALSVVEDFGLNREIPAFDINQSCSGFIYGLYVAGRLGDRVLMVCADRLRMSGECDQFIFSDAAAACICDGDTQCFAFENQPSIESLWAPRSGLLEMNGGAVFDFVTKNVPDWITDWASLDFLCQHQANESMMKLVALRSGYKDKNLNVIGEYGNCSMVSIPIALAACEDQILGKSVLLAGYGAGFSAAFTQMHWPSEKICSLTEV